MLVPFVLPIINIGLYYRVKGYVHFFEIIFRRGVGDGEFRFDTVQFTAGSFIPGWKVWRLKEDSHRQWARRLPIAMELWGQVYVILHDTI